MSEAVTALKNARYDAGIATISEIGPLGMITLRGDLDAPFLRKVVKKVTGVEREIAQIKEKQDKMMEMMSNLLDAVKPSK